MEMGKYSTSVMLFTDLEPGTQEYHCSHRVAVYRLSFMFGFAAVTTPPCHTDHFWYHEATKNWYAMLLLRAIQLGFLVQENANNVNAK